MERRIGSNCPRRRTAASRSPTAEMASPRSMEWTMRVNEVVACIGLFALPSVVTAQAPPKVHELKASVATVHRGFFDASLTPVLTVDSGDIVRLETASGNPRYFESIGVPKEKIP